MTCVRILVALVILVAVRAEAADTVGSVAAKARAEAKRWKSDAILVEVQAHPQPDGTLGAGHGASFTFLSPSTKQALMVALADGKPMSMPMPGAQSTLAIPDRFIDLPQALAAAKQRGFGTPVQAGLKVYPAEHGNRVAWMLAGMPGRDPNAATMYVDATSGAVITFADISGQSAREATTASLSEQKFPVDDPIDYASLKAKADAMAASQSPAFKLHQVEVVFASTTLRIEEAAFHYSRPAPPRGGPAAGWERILVHVRAPRVVGGSRKYMTPGSIIGERGEFDDPRPTPAPTTVLAPDEAIRRLGREPMPAPFGGGDPGGIRHRPDDWKLHVQLIKVGAGYSAGLPPLSPTWRNGDGSFGRDAFFNETAPKGKWVWWTMTQHPGAGGEQLEYIYLDAATGEATSFCGEPQSNRLVRVPCPAPGSQPVPAARTRRGR